MVLLDALYINNGGGKVLLDYLVSELERKDLEVFYLFDKRIEGAYSFVQEENKLFLSSSPMRRFLFYKSHGKRFETILCFGNLPPITRQNSFTYTYFHQPLFLNVPATLNWKTKWLIRLKTNFLSFIKGNTDIYFVQSSFIKNSLTKKYGLESPKVRVLPFYPSMDGISTLLKKEKLSFLYVSSGSPHKNQDKLLDAFASFYKKYKKGKLTLTISADYPDLLAKISILQNQNIPISNLGFIDREKLIHHYEKSEYIIFPSLAESFGLGLIEGIEMGCKVLGADLSYTYEVCRPSYAFNPNITKEIEKAFIVALQKDLPYSEPLIRNEIEEIIKLLNFKDQENVQE